MLGSLFDRLPASHFGMPDRPSRQWILEQSGLSGRVMVTTPREAKVPIPEGRAAQLFTHALYVVDCDDEEECVCSNDDTVPWVFVEYFNINEQVITPGVWPDGLPLLKRLLGEDK